MIAKFLKAVSGILFRARPFAKNEVYRVRGSQGNTYRVNMTKIECSCPDFYKRRQSFPSDDPRRLCKHLIHTYIREGSPNHDFELYLIFFQLFCERSGFPIGYRKILTDSDGYRFEIVAWADAKWFNIITTHPGLHDFGDVYGYNPYDFRWSSGDEAPDSNRIERLINEMVGQKLPDEINDEVEVYKRVSPKNANRGKEYLLYGRIGAHKIILRIPSRNSDYHYLVIDRDVHLPIEFRGNEPSFRGGCPLKYAHIKSSLMRWVYRERKEIADSRCLPLTKDDEKAFMKLLELLPDEKHRHFTSCEKLKSYAVICIGRNTDYWIARMSAKRDYIEIKMRDGQQFQYSVKNFYPVTEESVIASFTAAIMDDICRGSNSQYSKDFPELVIHYRKKWF